MVDQQQASEARAVVVVVVVSQSSPEAAVRPATSRLTPIEDSRRKSCFRFILPDQVKRGASCVLREGAGECEGEIGNME